jgi:transmembrane sensor
MKPQGSCSPAPDRLKSEARQLLIRLKSGHATMADVQETKRWRALSPAHAEAFDEARLLWTGMRSAAGQLAGWEHLTSGAPGRFGRLRNNLGRRELFGGALAAATAGIAVVHPPFGLWPSLEELAAQYRTRTGEQRQILVAGGTSIEMNTQTSLNVRSAAKKGNRIELVSGEAAVTAGVEQVTLLAANGWTAAEAAKFNVLYDGSVVYVTCLGGEVRVGCQGRIVSLPQNMQITYSEQGFGTTQTVDPAVVAAWRERTLIFRNASLAEVIREVNRYRQGKIFLMNPALGSHTIYANFSLEQIDDVITLLHESYGATVTRLPDGVILLS